MSAESGPEQHRSRRHRAAAWLGLMALLALSVGVRWTSETPLLRTDIRALLPDPPVSHARVASAQRSLSAPFEQDTVWLVGCSSARQAAERARQLGERLRASGVFADVRVEVDQHRWARVIEALRPYRHGLVTRADAARLRERPAAFLERRVAAQYSLVGAAGGSLASDPFGLYERFVRAALEPGATRQRRLVGDIPIIAGASGQHFAVIEARVRTQAFEARANPPLLGVWREALAWAERASVELHATGAPLYSAHASANAHDEITLIGGVSLAAIVVLLLGRFRSVRPLALTLIVIAAGVGTGFAATLWLFTSIHLITLVFGATVIGVSVDYAFHYLCDSLRPAWTPEAGLAHVRPALRLALTSSALAFLSLALAPFPALREVAVFVTGGLVGAWLTVVLLLPAMVRPARRAKPPGRWVLARRPRPLWTAGVVVAVTVPGVLMLTPDDDVRLLYAAPDRLERDDRAIGRLLARPDSSRFLLVTANGPQALLRRQEAIVPALEDLVGAGTLDDYRMVAELVPSLARQRRNERLLRTLVAQGIYGAQLRRLGFSADRVARVERSIRTPGPYLRPASGLDAVGPLLRSTWLGCGGGECGAAVVLSGAPGGDASPLARLADGREGVRWVDRVASINEAMRSHRRFSLGLLGVALAIVAVVLAVTLGPRRSLRVVAVPGLAVLASLATIGYTGALFNVFNMMALLLVLGVGIDYALFYERAGRAGQATAALAISMAALTTLLAFGLLMLSGTPVIRSFGITLVPGLMAAYALSLLLTGQPGADGEGGHGV